MALAKCNMAAKCERAPFCEKGRPHPVDANCNKMSICYDIRPYAEGGVRTWCDLIETPKEEDGMSETNLVQGPVRKVEAEVAKTEGRTGRGLRLNDWEETLMAAGGIRLGRARRHRDELEDLLAIRQMKESGGYRAFVEKAREDGIAGDDRPWVEFAKLMGWRRQSLDENLKALDEFGAETIGLILESGLPQVGVRALLAAPADMKRDLKAKGAEVGLEDLRRVLDQMEAAHQRADRERDRAEKERSRAEKAEKEAQKVKDRLLESAQDARDLQARIGLLEAARKNANAVEAEKTVEHCKRLFSQMLNSLGGVDFQKCDQAAATVLGFLDEMVPALYEQMSDLREQLFAGR